MEPDLYALLMKAGGFERQKAKDMLNALAYSRNTQAYFAHWPEDAQSDATLRAYAEALHGYKLPLLKDARKTRYVTTFTGRKIVVEKGMRLHAGKTFNWRVQGTVADIINPACLSLLGVVKVVIPMHDAIYAVLPICSGAEYVACLIKSSAHEIGIDVDVQTEVKYSR
jgi:DNA polymerase I-like protein with 3'-5' exonuclease and polymerase domains